MPTKDLFHDIRITDLCVAGNQTSVATAALFNSGTLGVDTSGYESTILLLEFSDISTGGQAYVFTLTENNTGTTTDGSAVAITQCDAKVVDGNATFQAKIAAATAGKPFTMTGNADEEHLYAWEYTGDMRYVKLTATVGAQAITPRMVAIQSGQRRGPFLV